MALIDELKAQHKQAWGARETELAFADTHIRRADELRLHIEDLDICIAALEPPAEATPEPEPEPEIPEGFTKWEGGDCPVDPYATVEIMHPNGQHHFGSAENVWWQWRNSSASDGIIAYRVLQPAPVPDEQDDASEFAEPAFDSVTISGGEELPQSAQDQIAEHFAENPPQILSPIVQPEWDEPEPAQATTLEADALAKALDYYDPKAMAERERRNPFNIFRKEGDQ